MKILVLGHSDSDGTRLSNSADAWPWLLQNQLEGLGTPTEDVHRLLFAGPSAGRFVHSQLERESPDTVILATSSYGVVLQLVSNRVRQSFGDRAGTAAARLERFAAMHAGRPGSGRRAFTARMRRYGRRIAGTRPSLSVGGLINSYEECFDVLARAENVHTIILAGAGYTAEQTVLNPGWPKLQARIHGQLESAARSHHFDWLVHEELLGGRSAKETYYHADGVHTDERSNLLVAQALLPLIQAKH
jgi:hypothetical protein